MFIAFFKNNSFPLLGFDYSNHPDCIYCEDADFDPETQIAELIEKDGKYSVKISQKNIDPIKETRDEKFARVYKKLVALPELNATTDTAILEGVEFTDKEIGDLIVDRVFDGNPHAESSIFANLLSGRHDPVFMQWVGIKRLLTSHILEFFKMDGIGEKEREEAKERTKKEIEAMKIAPAKKPNS